VSFLDDTEHFDDGVVHDLGEKNGSNLKWDLSPQLASRAISLIRFRATFLTSQRELEWTFTPKAMVGE
jgi:hypothetical protein